MRYSLTSEKKLPNRNPIAIPDHSLRVSGRGVVGYTSCRYTDDATIDKIKNTDTTHPLSMIPVTIFFVLELGLVTISAMLYLAYSGMGPITV
jgi:hypothetical protein